MRIPPSPSHFLDSSRSLVHRYTGTHGKGGVSTNKYWILEHPFRYGQKLHPEWFHQRDPESCLPNSSGKLFDTVHKERRYIPEDLRRSLRALILADNKASYFSAGILIAESKRCGCVCRTFSSSDAEHTQISRQILFSCNAWFQETSQK